MGLKDVVSSIVYRGIRISVIEAAVGFDDLVRLKACRCGDDTLGIDLSSIDGIVDEKKNQFSLKVGMVVILLMVYMRGMAYGNFQELYKLPPQAKLFAAQKKTFIYKFLHFNGIFLRIDILEVCLID